MRSLPNIPKNKLRTLVGFSMIAAALAFFSLTYPLVGEKNRPAFIEQETRKTQSVEKDEIFKYGLYINKSDLRPTFRLIIFLLISTATFLLLWRGALGLSIFLQVGCIATYGFWSSRTFLQLRDSETIDLSIENFFTQSGTLFDYLSFIGILALLIWQTNLIYRMLRNTRNDSK